MKNNNKKFQSIIIVNFLLMLVSCSIINPLSENEKQTIITNSKKCEWKPKLHSFYGIGHIVYESISNNEEKPPIILLHQLPGLSEETLDYAQTLTDDFSVYVPLLFGNVNMDNSFYGSIHYLFNSEWHPKENRPIHEWVRQLSTEIIKKHPLQKMGVIGMCLTGAMPLALLENKQINSIVLSQPTLPVISLRHSTKASLDLSELEYSVAKQRILSGKVKILGLRFQLDKIAKREKLKTLKTDFSNAYIDLEICKDDYVKHNIDFKAHSVLIDAWNINQKEINPVNIRRQKVLQFFKSQLKNEGEIPEGKSCLKSN